MRNHRGLLSESLDFVSCLYHAYHLPLRTFHFRSGVHQHLGLHGTLRLSDLKGPVRGVFQSLRPQRRHRCTPDDYERRSFYNGITGDGDHPELVYRSDYLTTPFAKPVSRYAHIPVKSVRGVFDTPRNSVWQTVSPRFVT